MKHKSNCFCDKFKIISNIEIIFGYYKIVLVGKNIANEAHPGQFVHIRVNDSYEPLLRRPLSIHRVKGQGTRSKKQEIEIIYKVVGRGTEILSRKRTGEYLDIIGPLGKGYHLPIIPSQLPILVGGGYGIAPLYFLAETLTTNYSSITPLVVIGAKTKKLLLCKEEFEKLNCKVKVATEDGTEGYKGSVTELLESELRAQATEDKGKNFSLLTIYSCGPYQMLKEVARIAKKNKIKCQVSLEQNMACGIGACLGCVIKIRTKEQYNRVCRDGPVFNAEEIIW